MFSDYAKARINLCPFCDAETDHAANHLGETGIRSRDGLTWTRLTLSDEAIKGLARGMLRLEAVPTMPEPVQAPPAASEAAARAAMSAALFEARDRLVALSAEIAHRSAAKAASEPLERVQEWVSAARAAAWVANEPPGEPGLSDAGIALAARLGLGGAD